MKEVEIDTTTKDYPTLRELVNISHKTARMYGLASGVLIVVGCEIALALAAWTLRWAWVVMR